MRPPERIDEILKLIEGIWKKNPDMRFMQLLYLLQMECAESQDGRGKVIEIEKDGFEKIGFDLFHLEDNLLKNILMSHPQQKNQPNN